MENLRSIIEAQNRSPESTSPDESISKRDHRGVHALGNRKPHKLLILRFFKPKSSRLARSSENNLQVQRHGSRSPASSYLDFLISAQLLTCRHQKSLVIILGLPGARQELGRSWGGPTPCELVPRASPAVLGAHGGVATSSRDASYLHPMDRTSPLKQIGMKRHFCDVQKR